MKSLLIPMLLLLAAPAVVEAQFNPSNPFERIPPKPEDWFRDPSPFPRRDRDHHTQYTEVPSNSSRPKKQEKPIQFDEGVQSRRKVHTLNGQRFIMQGNKPVPLAPKQPQTGNYTKPNSQLGKKAPVRVWQNGRWVTVYQ